MKEHCLHHSWVYVYRRPWYRLWIRHVYRRCANCKDRRRG